MFKYGNSISKLSHDIIKSYCSSFDVAIDGTLGNGYDTDFLSSVFSRVYSFEIQDLAVEKYKSKCNDNTTLINDSHEYVDKYINENIDCAIYNLGYLPGGDKHITTRCHSTLKSLSSTLNLLNNGGIVVICIYSGHEEGQKEKDSILDFVKSLPKNKFSVILHEYMNRSNNPPSLLIIEKAI